MTDKSRLLVFTSGAENFNKFQNLMSPVLEPNKYSIESLSRSDFNLTNLNEKCAALFLLDGEQSLDDDLRAIVRKFVFASNGRAMLFCDFARNPESQFWLLKSGVKDDHCIPDVVDLFKKFVNKEDIPINRQAVQLTGSETDDELIVALVRVENAVEYLSASSESGSQAVFVASTSERAFQQPQAIWSDLANAVSLDIATIKPQPIVQSLAATSEVVLVYTGSKGEDAERFTKFDSAVRNLLKPDSIKYRHLDQPKLNSDINLSKICKALLLAPASSREFDGKGRKNLISFFSSGGKLMFFGEHEQDADWLWFLSCAFKDKKMLQTVQMAFDRFVKGERIPTDLQALQLSSENDDGNEFSVAFVTVENLIPVLYLSREGGSTVAFAASSPERVMDQNTTVWKDLLRIIDVNLLPGQDHRFTFGRMLSRVEDENVRNTVQNLFIYNGLREDVAEFNKFVNNFRSVLRRDTYTIYPISHEFFSNKAWMPHCRALVVSCEHSAQIEEGARILMHEYFNKGGKLMFFCDLKSDRDALWFLKSIMNDQSTVDKIRDGFNRFDRTSLMPINLTGKQTAKGADKNISEHYIAMMRIENVASVLYLSTDSSGTVVFVAGDPACLLSQNLEVWKDIVRVLDLDVSNTLQRSLTSGYLIARDKEWQNKVYAALKGPMENVQDLVFVKTSTHSDSSAFPLRINEMHKDFDKDNYFKCLHTKSLGCISVFIPVSRSAAHIASSLEAATYGQEIVVIAGQQNAGEGFLKQWVSPLGSASFAFVLKVVKKSNLGLRITFAKNLAALAVVKCIKSMDNYVEMTKRNKKFSVGIKWPNDIYLFGKVKIGGVFTSTTERETDYIINIEIGLNVSNHRPTACLNDFVSDNIEPFKIEFVIATALNEFESLVTQIQTQGLSNAVAEFENNCINLCQDVQLYKTKEKGFIVGVDDHGNLKVKLNETGQTVSVTCDTTIGLGLSSLDFLIKIAY